MAIPVELTLALSALIDRFGERKFASAVSRLKWERGTIKDRIERRRVHGQPPIGEQVDAIFAGKPISERDERFSVTCCGLRCEVRLNKPSSEALTFLAIHAAHGFAWEPTALRGQG